MYLFDVRRQDYRRRSLSNHLYYAAIQYRMPVVVYTLMLKLVNDNVQHLHYKHAFVYGFKT